MLRARCRMAASASASAAAAAAAAASNAFWWRQYEAVQQVHAAGTNLTPQLESWRNWQLRLFKDAKWQLRLFKDAK